MPASFEFSWRDDGILMVKRSGFMTLEEADEYLEATRKAAESAPAMWGIVVDVRDAPPQRGDVQAKIQDVAAFHAAQRGMRRIAVVGSSVLTQMQQKRITTGPGLHDKSKIAFHTDIDEAIRDVKAALG